MFLISLPEAAYAKIGEDRVAHWFPPNGMWFKFQILEFPDDTSLENLKSNLLVSETLVYLTKEEIANYAKKYGRG